MPWWSSSSSLQATGAAWSFDVDPHDAAIGQGVATERLDGQQRILRHSKADVGSAIATAILIFGHTDALDCTEGSKDLELGDA